MNEHEETNKEILKDILHVLNGIQEGMRPEPLSPATLEAIPPGQVIKCIQCIGEEKSEKLRRESMPLPVDEKEREGLLAILEETPIPPIRNAVTFSPSWQQTTLPSPMGMQMVTTCVSLPVCYEHIEVREKTAEERAVAGGKILPGRMN